MLEANTTARDGVFPGCAPAFTTQQKCSHCPSPLPNRHGLHQVVRSLNKQFSLVHGAAFIGVLSDAFVLDKCAHVAVKIEVIQKRLSPKPCPRPASPSLP